MSSLLGKFGFRRRGSSTEAISCEVEQVLRNSKSQIFDYATLKSASNDFKNIVGHGSFGRVYKGELEHGRPIAIKIFDTSSTRLQELKNMVVWGSLLKHKNILKFIGCCLKNKTVFLVYDYLPNGSLDKYLFDPIKKQKLEWETRYKIIEGIANGILYLHEGLDIRIIHSDLKPGNILLDSDMNPTISGFDIAKILDFNHHEGTSESIIGTMGYMAPEYINEGRFSTKTDIFSFGITILEIITGQRNYHCAIDNIWKHWIEGTAAEVIDPSIVDQCPKDEVLRCMHIGLACIQCKPEERPSIASLILMLISDAIRVPTLKTPLEDVEVLNYCHSDHTDTDVSEIFDGVGR